MPLLKGGDRVTIKEVSEKYGISQDTLRYYECSGIIPPVSRTASGIRDYQQSDLGWVELSLCLRNAGVSVQAIAEYVRLALEGDGTIADRLNILRGERESLYEQKTQLCAALDRLDYKIALYEQKLCRLSKEDK